MSGATDTIREYDQARREALWPDGDRLYRAICIAKDLATCNALLHGESVPDERIDWEQARRFERR